MNFDFATANRILFGNGKVHEVARIVASYGRQTLLIHGRHAAGVETLRSDLESAGVNVVDYISSGEPDVPSIERGVQSAREKQIEVVIAIGGGSVLDTGKAVAALVANDRPILDYLEVVGQGLPLIKPVLPVIAIPTTAGTGSEVSRNAVISVPEKRVKVSLRSPAMLPKVAVVDPQLTLSLPPVITANSGLDALTQVLEPYVSRKANPMTDLFCKEGLQLAARSLRAAYEHGDDLTAREGMSWASLLGGLALANAGLGAVHGFAGPLGGLYDAPHGALCAALLAPVMRVNSETFLRTQPDHPAVARYADIACFLTGNPAARIEDGIQWLEDLTQALNIARLRAFGISPRDFQLIIEKASVSSSMKGNPIELSSSELLRILEMAF
ncbi:alcohol dehydrogenase, class IV [Longilinea arvoryzae]|uniref:Alcohol dehydrogenase, class IV n=1 Tax=Longilinea arvoryzae TaxID=360412 RepID=A0A0S7BM39_9CHLR|nr:iron-containing alcohol dehydrogenase [Longilinea arvoryzae]GAP14762.1 alcohol dehydrogenase, class IV [Longilinea arvoryzae]